MSARVQTSELTRRRPRSAAVVCKEAYRGKITEDEIVKLVAGALPKHCTPRLVVFYEALPRNGVGKTDKVRAQARALRDVRSSTLMKDIDSICPCFTLQRILKGEVVKVWLERHKSFKQDIASKL